MRALVAALAALIVLAIAAPAGAAEGNFLVSCTPDPNGVRIADPIGGATHPHVFAGVPGISNTSTLYDLLYGGSTTCQVGGETPAIWHPAVQAPDGSLVGFTTAAIYYRNNDAATQQVLPFPLGLRHVHGNPANNDANRYAAVYRCFGASGTSTYLPASCAAGQGFQETMFFAQCWDGLALDETNGGLAHHTMTTCDAAHPIRLPGINLIINWPQEAVGGMFTSDIEHGTRPGLSAHADYWFGLNPFFFTKVVERCLNAGIQCRVGNGQGGSRAGDIYQFGTSPAKEILTPDEAKGL